MLINKMRNTTSTSDDSDDLYDTQTPNENTLFFNSEEVQALRVKPYGKLVSSIVYLPSIVLDKSSYVLGRSADCDIIISKSNFSPSSLIAISKFHFKISCEHNKLATITDLSKNGTFVNRTLIGKDQSRILRHDDEISVGLSSNKVYTFQQIEIPYLPDELEEKYEIVRLLGRGACGEVMLAQEKQTQKKYAIKKIIKKKLSNKFNLNDPIRIENEVKILRSLKHPCIISTNDVIESDEAVFIVLEYMAGGELTDLMLSSNSPLPENAVKLIFYQLVMGIRYLHLHNITHRDLKPGNILLNSKTPLTVVKIADFGLSKVIESKSCMVTCCGTPSYVAPEVIDPHSKLYTQQVDIWSLGVVLFEMLSGELPFSTATNRPNNVCGLILFSDFSMTSTAWNSVSNAAKDLITKMLLKNPEERYTIHEVANHPWLAQDTEMQKQVKDILFKHTNEDEYKSEDGPPKKKLKTD